MRVEYERIEKWGASFPFDPESYGRVVIALSDVVRQTAEQETAPLLQYIRDDKDKLGIEAFMEAWYYADLIKAFLRWPYEKYTGIWGLLFQAADYAFVTENKVLESLAEDHLLWDIITALDDLLAVHLEPLLTGPAQKFKDFLDALYKDIKSQVDKVDRAKAALAGQANEPGGGDSSGAGSGGTPKKATVKDSSLDEMRQVFIDFMQGDNQKSPELVALLKQRIVNDLRKALIAHINENILLGSRTLKEVESLLEIASKDPRKEAEFFDPKKKGDAKKHAPTALLNLVEYGREIGPPPRALVQEDLLKNEWETRLVVKGWRALNQYLKDDKLTLAKLFDQIIRIEKAQPGDKRADKDGEILEGEIPFEIRNQGLSLIKPSKDFIYTTILLNKLKQAPIMKIRAPGGLLPALDELVAFIQGLVVIPQRSDNPLRARWKIYTQDIEKRANKIFALITDFKNMLKELDNPKRVKEKVKFLDLGH